MAMLGYREVISLQEVLEKAARGELTRPARPHIAPFPGLDRRFYAFPPGKTTIDIASGAATFESGREQQRFQVVPGFIARSIFMACDTHIDLIVQNDDGSTWGPLFAESITPISIVGVRAKTLILDSGFPFDGQIVFSDDIVPPVRIEAFGGFAIIRYSGSFATGTPGAWVDVPMGACSEDVQLLVARSERRAPLVVCNTGSKLWVVRNTGANNCNVRIVGVQVRGEEYTSDAQTGTGGVGVAAGDFAHIPVNRAWHTVKLQVQTPVGGTPTTITVQFMGHAMSGKMD